MLEFSSGDIAEKPVAGYPLSGQRLAPGTSQALILEGQCHLEIQFQGTGRTPELLEKTESGPHLPPEVCRQPS